MKLINLFTLIIAIIVIIMCPLSFAAEVKNFKHSKIGNYIVFEYDLSGETDETEALVFFTITIGGHIYKPDNLHMNGDFGKVTVGKGKKIYWNVLQDFPGGIPPRTDYSIVSAGKTFREEITGTEFILVKGGCYEMGDLFGDGDSNERPVHEVCVDDFYLGKYEVTLKEFSKFIEDTNYKTEAERDNGCNTLLDNQWKRDINASWRNPDFNQDSDSHPVVCVSWNDANRFLDWLNSKTKRGYRLPTEAEREYAGRSGGKKYKYSWGNEEPSGNVADETARRMFPNWTVFEGYNDGYVFTAPVGSFKPNELGLYDMTGNVWEWTIDIYETRYYEESPKNNPTGPKTGHDRVLRGGGWNNGPRGSRTSFRGRFEPWARFNDVGFRLALPAKP